MAGPSTGEIDLAPQVLDACLERGLMVTSAESCTGGLVAAALTDIAGSSAVFERGFVTYSNEAKIELLGVSPQTLAAHGAVSAHIAAEMVRGALRHSHAHIAVSITGIAGPGGGSDDKPVGLVWFGVADIHHEPRTVERRFGDIGRAGIRDAALKVALELLLETARAYPTPATSSDP